MSRRLVAGALKRWGYDVLSVADGVEAWTVLKSPGAPSLAILNWMMPRVDGAEVCRKVRQQQDGPYIYIILLTGRDRKKDVVEGLEAGADDYITKPFDAHELHARIRAARRILDLQERLVASLRELESRATHDYLTQTWNRRAIFDILGRELDRGRRQDTPLGVLLLDVDLFKSVNDAHGHLAGDEVLREVARRMSVSLRPYDFVGRFGGEEFLVIAPQCDAAAALQLGERLRAAIASAPIKLDPAEVRVTISVGAASSATNDSCEPDALLRAADAALYSAKRAGRNRVAAAPVRQVCVPVPSGNRSGD